MSDEAVQDQNGEQNAPMKKKSKWPLFTVLTVLILIGVLVFFYWLFWGQYKVTTTDSYVQGNIIEVFPRIRGNFQNINVNNNDYVKEGQVLATLDPTDFQIQFDEAQANLAATLRNVQQMFDQVNELMASLEQQMVYLGQAQTHFMHRQALVGVGGVSRENFEDSQSALLAAEAEVVKIEESLKKAQTQTYNTTVLTHPLVINAIESVKKSWINLCYTQIKAPYEGFIARKTAQVGETASPTLGLLSIVPLDNLWVTANLKESQLSKIRIGQPVVVKTDLYKRHKIFQGIVLGIAPGTGSVFSILPPQNATGNWIKIVQRVPVKIGLRPHEIEQFPLRVGLSTEVVIDVEDQAGSVLTKAGPTCPIYQTDIYEGQLIGVDPIIQQIIEANLNLCDGE